MEHIDLGAREQIQKLEGRVEELELTLEDLLQGILAALKGTQTDE